MYDVKGRRAIITGGAMGFGKEFGVQLVGAGCKVCLSDVNEVVGQQAKKEIQEKFGVGEERVCFAKCDVAKKEDWATMWDYAEKTLGGQVEILCNNAGMNTLCGWEMNLDVMLVGASRGLYYAIERMGKTNGGSGGRIINTASMAGLYISTSLLISTIGPLHSAGYTIAKQSIVALTRCFRSATFKEEGVKCYALCPWFADTNLVREVLFKSIKVKGREINTMDDFEKKTRVRALTVEEVGLALMKSLELDKNTAVYMVIPDTPLIEYPDYRSSYLNMVVALAKYVAGPLGLQHFSPTHFYLTLVFALFFLSTLFKLFLNLIF